jgi:predicted transcriptional regulator
VSIEFTGLLSDSQREYVEIEDREECRSLEDLAEKIG